MHLAVTGDWPDEAARRAFGEEAQSVTVSPQHFYLVTPASAEDEQVSGERVILQDVLNFDAAVKAISHIGDTCNQPDTRTCRRDIISGCPLFRG
ncbi:hypothetical protein BANRA_04630 [Escherichia coli]|nr:hypothetical protein BANRA_04630 [Escherichia coli]